MREDSDDEWGSTDEEEFFVVNPDGGGSGGYEHLPATHMLASHCMYCGRPLEDPESVEQGCGPICADKYGVFAPSPGIIDEASLRAALDMAPAHLRAEVEAALPDRNAAMKKINHLAGYRWERQSEDWGAYMGSAIELASALGYAEVAAKLRKRYIEGGDHGGPDRGLVIEEIRPGTWGFVQPYIASYATWRNMSNALKNAGATETRGRPTRYSFPATQWLSVLNALVGPFPGRLGVLPNGEPFVVPAAPVPLPAPDTPPAGPPTEATGETMPKPTISKGDQVQLKDGMTLYVRWVSADGSRIGVGSREQRGGYLFLGTNEVRLVEPTRAEVEETTAVADEPVKAREVPEWMFPYQREGVLWLDQKRSGLVAWDMGLGKTRLSCVALDAPAVIVCPAVMRADWAKELNYARPDLTASIVYGTATPDQLRADVLIVNYDVLAKNLDALMGRPNRTIVFDEATALKNLQLRLDRGSGQQKVKGPKRAVAGYKLAMTPSPRPRRLLLSGTPIMNRACELFPLLHFVDPETWDNYFKFGMRYCDAQKVPIGRGKTAWEFKGSSNLKELHERISGKYMIRKLKTEVLDLPEKSRESLPVALDPATAKEYKRAAAEFLRWVEEQGGPEAALRAARAETLARMNALRRLCAVGKVEAAIDWVRRHHEETERPLVIFAHHREVLESVTAALTEMGLKVGQIIGGMDPHVRDEVKTHFQDGVPAEAPPEARDYLDVVVCSIMAAGMGLTLTRASEALFIERAWRPADLAQAEDRIYRIGQRNAITITYLDVQGSIDDEIASLLLAKVETFEGLINGRDVTESDAQAIVFGRMFNVQAPGMRENPEERGAAATWTDPLELGESRGIEEGDGEAHQQHEEHVSRPNPRRKKPVVEREMEFSGYTFTASPEGTTIHRRYVRTDAPGDYGADPLGPDETGEFTWRMVPSGDVVYRDEMRRRLGR